MCSLENWSPIMLQSMWSTSLDQQPLFNANIFMSLYFIVFIILCVFFILNMVIGVAINTFERVKEERGRSILLTEAQQEWLTVQVGGCGYKCGSNRILLIASKEVKASLVFSRKCQVLQDHSTVLIDGLLVGLKVASPT